MKDVVICGSGGFATELNQLCEVVGFKVVGFLNDNKDDMGSLVDGVEILGSIESIGSLVGKVSVLVAGVGSPKLKEAFLCRVRSSGHNIAESIIHPSVNLHRSVKVGEGSIILGGCSLTVNIKVGNFVILNLHSTVGHGATINNFSTISPGVNISGDVNVGEGAFLGTGCSIREKINIGSWSTIGGGAFVATDITPNSLWVGVPAKLKRSY